ncbi:sensor histidine kinase [Aliikangiella coralliicola]|uniref:Uncharacterized protein n=1 Tax=Aliikangiella coralliicola TaxID=2592383 RepID=A0A545UBM4_9GAMM|nr:histidine kinase [Aliikangiella coralliicola]TQV86866.1 hypothetical protein FLL46_13700 [Aliikangiella coralliicola]
MSFQSDAKTDYKIAFTLISSILVGLVVYNLLSQVSGLLTIHNYKHQFWPYLEFLVLKIWLPWVIMTPLVIWIGRRFPITPQNWSKALILHTLILISISIVEVGVISFHYHFFETMPETMKTYEPWQHIGHFLFGDSVFLFNLIIYTFFIASVNIKNFSELAQQKELVATQLSNRLMQSQLQTLKMQINPHFLFNTLNVISVLVMKSEQQQANEMINRLSRFFRQSLEESEGHWVSLAEELDHLGQYLAIEKVRFGDRLTVIEEYESKAMGVKFPSMLLQPLVENAVQHGLGEKEGPGILTIQCQCTADKVTIKISDDGVGCNFSDSRHYKEGIGISNVRARLAQIYPNHHRFEINSRPSGGVKVTIEVPVTPPNIELVEADKSGHIA